MEGIEEPSDDRVNLDAAEEEALAELDPFDANEFAVRREAAEGLAGGGRPAKPLQAPPARHVGLIVALVVAGVFFRKYRVTESCCSYS